MRQRIILGLIFKSHEKWRSLLKRRTQDMIVFLTILSLLFIFFPPEALSFQHPDFSPGFLWEEYEKFKVSPENPRLLKHARMVSMLKKFQKKDASLMRLTIVGQSVEGRDIYLVTLGRGKSKILLWSQMHGDEPTATSALMDIFNYLLERKNTPFVKEILERTTLLVLPMLNPDGAEKFVRRNALDLDINRDARDFQTPEGRILKSVRDRFQPQFGFNLHNQNSRRTVGKTNKIVAIALLVPPFDYENNDNPVRIRARKVASVVYQAVAPYSYGHVAKYNDEYMPRAFGDAMQSWGTSTVLIETGGWFKNNFTYLVRLNFVGLLSAFQAIATGRYQQANPALYDSLPENDKELFDLLITNATILDGSNLPPFITDIGINIEISEDSDGALVQKGIIKDLGDLEIFAAKDTIDAQDMIVTPGFISMVPSINPGNIVDGDNMVSYLKKGITTVVGSYILGDAKSLKVYLDDLKTRKWLTNIAFVAVWNHNPDLLFTEGLRLLGQSMTQGALGLLLNPRALNNREANQAKELVSWFGGVNLIPVDVSSLTVKDSFSRYRVTEMTSRRAQKWGLAKRGQIRLGNFADLLIFKKTANTTEEQIALEDLKYVMVNGALVLEKGRVSEKRVGRIIPRGQPGL